MLDNIIRSCIAPILRLAVYPLQGRITPNQLTIVGFIIGLTTVPLLALQLYWMALGVLLLNRFIDGLDGALAQATHTSDFGGFLDIVCDFILYAAVAAGFGLAQPQYYWISLALIVSFVATGSSFLAYAALAQKHNISKNVQQNKAFHYIGGLIEGTETIVFFALVCLFPQWFWLMGLLFTLLCCITAASRCLQAQQDFKTHTPQAIISRTSNSSQ